MAAAYTDTEPKAVAPLRTAGPCTTPHVTCGILSYNLIESVKQQTSTRSRECQLNSYSYSEFFNCQLFRPCKQWQFFNHLN